MMVTSMRMLPNIASPDSDITKNNKTSHLDSLFYKEPEYVNISAIWALDLCLLEKIKVLKIAVLSGSGETGSGVSSDRHQSLDAHVMEPA